MSPRYTLAALLLVGACGGGRAADPPPKPAARDAAIAPAPRPAAGDPLGEASLLADVEWLTAPARHGRGSLTDDAKAVAAWLVDELEAAGYAPVTQTIRGTDQVNVIASRGAGTPAVMVMAHYDHLGVVDGVIYPGADDNASGVAAALAVARDLAARDDVPGRVVFLFTGVEEPGLHGAQSYVDDAPVVPLADVKVVLNLDMVGRRFFESAGGGLDATIGAVGISEGDPLFAAAAGAAKDAGLELLAVQPELVALIGEDYRSDDWVFRERGVPSIHLSTGLNPDYHTPADTVDHLDRAQLVRVAQFLRGLVTALAQ